MKPQRLLLALLVGLCALAAVSAAPPTYDSESRSRKSDYYFLEALRQRALDREDLALAMMNRALQLNDVKTDDEAYELGLRLMVFGRSMRDSLLFDRGLQLCEGYFNEYPSDMFAGDQLAQAHAATGNIGRAVEILDILQSFYPTNALITANHADMLLRAKRLDEAINLYRNLEKVVGRNPSLTQRITNVMIWQGDTVGALAEIDDLIASQPRSVDALQLGAAAASQFGRLKQALGYLDRAKELDPTNGTTYYYAANVYKMQGRADDYDNAIRGAITGDDLERDAKIDLLRFYLDSELQGDSASAKIDPLFEALADQFTHDYEIRVLYMSYLASQKRWAQAAEQMELAVSLNPADPKDFLLLARLYGSAEDFNGVLNATEVGLSHHPNAIDLYQVQASVFVRKGNYSAAEETLRRALQIDSIGANERSEIYCDIADMGQQSGAPRDSIIAGYEKALELNPENDQAMNNYAYWLSITEGGDLLRAKELIARAVMYEPALPTYCDTYAWVAFRLGDLETAKRYIDMAITFDRSDLENNPEALDETLGHAAEIYQALGQLEKANEFRQRIQKK